jgi:hypothetical protein
LVLATGSRPRGLERCESASRHERPGPHCQRSGGYHRDHRGRRHWL